MGTKPTSLMTQYQNGQLATRELQQMMADYNSDSRFDRELTDDIDSWRDTRSEEYGFSREYPRREHGRQKS